MSSLPGLEVSDQGRIRSATTKKTVFTNRLRDGTLVWFEGTTRHVDRLVLEAFRPIPNSEDYFPKHLNHRLRDCKLTNLEWGGPISLVEVWKPVVGYEGWYEISDFGHVRSCDRSLVDTFDRSQSFEGQLRRPSGYSIYLCKQGRQTRHRVDDLVWEAFTGKKPSARLTHRNGDVKDNRLTNLALIIPDDLPAEEWRPIVGYEGYYEISSHRRVRSCDRRSPTTRVHGYPDAPTRQARGRLLKPGRTGVVLSKDGRTTYHRFDDLVWAAFGSEDARSPTPSTPQSPDGDHHEHQHPDDPA